jgi:hypothetical protein
LKTRTLITAAAFAAASLTGLASATPSTHTQEQTLDFNFSLSPNNTILSFNQFDDNGGQYELQSVTFMVDATIGANIVATNDSDIPAEFFAVNLTGAIQVTLNGETITANIFQSEAVPADDLPIAPGASYDFGFVSGNGSDSDTLNEGLGAFIGNGTIDADVFGTGGFSVQGVADATLVLSDFAAAGEVTIIYAYKIIPAPGALALLGLAGLAGTRRRRD